MKSNKPNTCLINIITNSFIAVKQAEPHCSGVTFVTTVYLRMSRNSCWIEINPKHSFVC